MPDATTTELTPLQQAVIALQAQRSRIAELERAASAPIAVIGIGCRYPADGISPSALWQALREGRDGSREVPPDRWDIDAVYDPVPGQPGKMYVRNGCFIGEVDRFEPLFFRISPREAIGIDPQHRLLLEVAWEALEDAAIAAPSLVGSDTGVFIGISTNDYSALLSRTAHGCVGNAVAGPGNAASVAAGRLSYTFGFHGPCVAIDTACSSSLVATHLAVQALRNKECSLAIVAGVNLMLSPEITINFCQGRMLAPDGHCKTFDEAADGYVRGEGCGALVLKRLAEAEADSDRILAVLRGSAINQDGRSAGLTAPNGLAQEAVIKKALANAGMRPDDIDYIEAHGTGTSLGDPIEMHALKAVFAGRSRPLHVGTVKTNIGHTEAASGVAGLIKAVLMLQHQALPPSLHFRRLNPHIDAAGIDFRVPTELVATSIGAIGVSSFGVSGTNAHIVLGAPPAPPVTAAPPSERPLLLISARTREALIELIGRYREFLATTSESFADVCHTAAIGRARLPWWVAVADPAELATAEPANTPPPLLPTTSGRKVALPIVAFQRERCWIDVPIDGFPQPPIAGFSKAAPDNGQHPLLGRKLPLPLSAETRWEAAVARRHPALAFLDEHRVGGSAIMPAAGFVEMALSARPGAALAGLAITRPLPLSEAGERRVQTIVAEDGGVSIVSYRADAGDPRAPITHASGRIVPRGSAGEAPPDRSGTALDAALLYQAMARRGVNHGPKFRLLDEITRGDGWASATLRGDDDEARFAIHPARLDAAFQLVGATLPEGNDEMLLPAAIDRVSLYHPPAANARVHASAARGPSGVVADIVVSDAAGVAVEIAGLQFRPTASAGTGSGFYRLEWRDAKLLDGLPPPAFLPDPEEVAAVLADAGDALAERHGIAAYARTAPILEAAATGYVVHALESLGLQFRPGGEFTFGAIAESLGVDERHHRLLRRLFSMLEEDGVLAGRGRRWRVVEKPPQTSPAAMIEALVKNAPDMTGEIAVLRRCGEALAEVLTGQVGALGLLFPAEGSGAGAFYETSPYARTVNSLLQAAAGRLAAALPRGRVLRVLEVGAGTGGATGAMLAALPRACRHYVFSDISQGFLTSAAAKFAGEEIETRLLDLERPSGEQGFAAGSFDIVLAANVLHATQDLAQSLAHIRDLLAPGGVLLLVESTERRRWVDIVFGLTDGWWRFTDTERRPDHPLLGAQQWRELLGECGFAVAAETQGEVIVARRAGAAPQTDEAWHVVSDARLPDLSAAGLRTASPAEAGNWVAVVPPTAPDEEAQVELLVQLTEIARAALAVLRPPRLVFVAEAGLGHAGIAGFVRTLAIEKPMLRPRLLIAPPSDAALIDELAAGEDAAEIGWGEADRRQQRVLVAADPAAGSRDLAGAWLITGARGGVGQAIAAWLADNGASEIVLLSREMPTAPVGIAVPVRAYAGDVADAALIARLLDAHSINGVVHAAGVLAVAPIEEQTAETIRAVAHAKIGGGLALDQATRNRPVRHFVLFASVAGVLGSARQVNHAFASSFLDGLAAQRQAEGLPALSLDWGVWSGIGSAAALGFDARADQLGLGSLTAEAGVRLFGRSLGATEPQLVVLPSVDWARFTANFEQGVPALFAALIGPGQAAAESATVAASGPAETIPDRTAALTRIVRQCLGLSGPIDPDTPLHDLGLDSLLAVEIRNRVERELGLTLSVRELIEGASLRSLAQAQQKPASAEPSARRGIVPDPQNRHLPFPLTDMQQAYWLGRRSDLALGSVGCYLYTEFDTSRVDLARAEAAWNQLVRRHDMLRVVIRPDGTQQILAEVPEYRFEQLDLRGRDAEDELERVRRTLAQRVAEPSSWPLFDIRATLLDDRVRLHIGFDLIALDAASIHALRQEWARLYDDPAATLPPLALSFRDVVVEEVAHRETAAWRRSEQYWKERAPDLPGAPELTVIGDPMRPVNRQFRRRRVVVEPDQAAALRRQAQARGLTLPALLAAAYADILAAWSRTSRFSITVTLFNRGDLHPDIRLVLGDFTSTILLEVDARPGHFAERAAALGHRLAADLEHAEFGGVRALREIARQRSGAAATVPFVFTSTLGFRRAEAADDAAGESGGWDQLGQTVFSVSSTPQVLIDHQISEEDGRLFCNWDAAEGMFPPGMLDHMAAAHQQLLAALAEDAGWMRPVSAALPPLSRAPFVPVVAADEMLHAAFERQARETPRRAALIAPDIELDYETLDAAASELAVQLLSRLGADARDRLVAIGFAKGWRQIVAVLAVLKAGAAYLPIDPSLPAARRHLLIERSGATLLDDEAEVDAALARARIGTMAPSLPPVAEPSRLAYVIYTSGSTGEPKGVMIEHRAALATVGEVNRRWRVGAEDRVLGLSSLSFDLSVYDIFGPLSVGGALVLPPPDAERDPSQWAELLRRQGVTIWNSVPALIAMQAEYGLPVGHRLRLVLLSGDWVPVELVSRLRRQAPEATLVALGGATEAAIWSNAHEIGALDPEWPSIPYGTPLAGHMLHVVNERGEPCPDWVTGEIEISGQGLARGYLNDRAQTAERFPIDPASGARRYRTGDLGRFRRYGTVSAATPTPIEFLGREDLQVKVQGHRIELGEVEAVLSNHPEIAEAVAVAPRTADGQQRTLHAFVVPRGAERQARTAGDISGSLSAYLRERLPAYMVPASIGLIDRVPLSANGKVDRGALAAAIRPAAYSGPASDRLEQEVATAVAEVMQLDRVDAQRSLFELGATSLTLVAMQRLLSDRFGRTVPLQRIFERPTAAGFAAELADSRALTSPLIRFDQRPHLDDRPALVLMPGVLSLPFYLRELAQAVADELAIVSVQLPGMAAGEAPIDTVEAQAEYVVGELHRGGLQPPYLLGGHSFGGLVAIEVARRLREAGDAVALLMLGDTVRTRSDFTEFQTDELAYTAMTRGIYALYGRLTKLPYEALDGLPAPEKFARAARQMQEEGLFGALELPLERMAAVFKANFRAIGGYRPGQIAGDLALIRTAGGFPAELLEYESGESLDDPGLGWSELVAGRLEIRTMPGDHLSMLDPAHLPSMARILIELVRDGLARYRRDATAGGVRR
ncbi:MAG TPA: amino acid adenylation domain-containing protein [Stellaceae bacterium]|jgi:amino acid adenylation domain-containing protein